MMMLQITPRKKEKMSELVEGILHDAGKLMQCVENLGESEDFGERRYGRIGERQGGMGMRSSNRYMGMRADDDMDDEDEEMGQRENYGDRRRRRYRY